MAKAAENIVVENETPSKKARVKVSLPRGTKNSLYVSVNGVAYLIPAKGEHEVPPEVAAELARAMDAEDRRDFNQEKMQAAAAANAAAVLKQIG